MRLIDADELIKRIQDIIDFDGKPNRAITLFSKQHILSILDNMKTVDPVKHGHWVYDVSTSTGDYFKCSECNASIFLYEGWKVSFKHVSDIKCYCHICGAKMDEEVQNE